MSIFLPILLFVIFGASVACLYAQGMWSNAIRLVNVVTAALLATNFFEPMAVWMERRAPTYTYVCDFLALWMLFVLFMLVFRVGTDLLSRVRVRFLKIVDLIGGVFFAAWIGWVMVCFTTMTLHTAPLSRNFMHGAFQPEKKMFAGTAPDRKWLGFAQKQSMGAFSRSITERDFERYPDWEQQWAEDKVRTFDPLSQFMPKYATRRANLEGYNSRYGKIRVRKDLISK